MAEEEYKYDVVRSSNLGSTHDDRFNLSFIAGDRSIIIFKDATRKEILSFLAVSMGEIEDIIGNLSGKEVPATTTA